MKHTPEPWVIDDGIDDPENMADELLRNAGEENEWIAIGIADEEGYAESVAYCHPNNAKRIVACVNALAGVKDPRKLLDVLEKVQDDLNKHISEHSPIVEELDTYEGEETTPACIHVKRAYNRLGELLDLLHRR